MLRFLAHRFGFDRVEAFLPAYSRVRHSLAQALRPTQEAFQKLLRVQGGKNPIESIMRGNAVAQSQKRLEPIIFGTTKILHIIERFAGAEQCADGDHQNINQIVVFGSINARI